MRWVCQAGGHSPSSGPLCTSQFEGSGSRLISLFLAASASSLLAMMSRAESSGPQRSPRRSERAPRGQRAVAGLDHLQEPCNRRLRRMRQCQARGRPYRRFCVWPRPWRHRRCACRRRRPYHIHNAACVEAGHRANAQARSEAIRRWPDRAALFARVKDDGLAESALIGVAGQTARRPWPSRVHLYALGSAQGARAGLMNGADRKAVKSELRGHANGDRPARYLD
jgi:hypothetical protein